MAPEVQEVPEALEGEDHPSRDGHDFLGQLTQNKDWWDSVGKNSFVREAVRGHRLEFESVPPVKKIMKKIKNKNILNFQKKKILQEEVESLLEKGAVEPVRHQHKGFYSNLFLVQKKDGGWRRVINLSGLNRYIKKKPFRMATLKDVSQSLRQGDWAATIDLKDAYLHVPIAKEHRRFLRFSLGGGGGDAVPVQKVTVRPQFSPPNVYEGNASSGNVIQDAEDQDNRLFGRFPGPREKQGGTKVAHRFRVERLEEGRVSEEPEKVQLGTKEGVPVPGSCLEHKESQSLSVSRQEERLQGVGCSAAEESQHSLSIEVLGQSYFCMEGSSLGETAYQTVPDVCNQGS